MNLVILLKSISGKPPSAGLVVQPMNSVKANAETSAVSNSRVAVYLLVSDYYCTKWLSGRRASHNLKLLTGRKKGRGSIVGFLARCRKTLISCDENIAVMGVQQRADRVISLCIDFPDAILKTQCEVKNSGFAEIKLCPLD
jgi:hypothetical protein